ncbi:MAG: hypothetical protein K5666_05340 [Bacilli bacterium]|nr:hypothetical protein [Bacilli bacterium]
MDDKNKTNTNESNLIPKTPTATVSQSLNEHLQQNLDLKPKESNKKKILTYIAMALVIIACIWIIYVFLDKNDANPFTKTTTTTTQGARTVETSSTEIVHASTVEISTSGTVEGKLIEQPTKSPQDTTTRSTFHTVERN